MARTDFHGLALYQPPTTEYGLLPFRLARFDEGRYLLTNDVGDHAILPAVDLEALVSKRLDPGSKTYLDLRAKNMVTDDRASVHGRILASRYRTKKSFLDGFTKLHMFVATLRCDHTADDALTNPSNYYDTDYCARYGIGGVVR